MNDLPIILAILKISINDSEMLQALKAIDIDGKFCVLSIEFKGLKI